MRPNLPSGFTRIPSRKRTIPFITAVLLRDSRAFISILSPWKLFRRPAEILVLFEYDSLRHPIYVDGRAHDTALGPLWMGDSIGHWDGDTLVVDTVNFNDKTWVDRVGHPHSGELHLIERFRRVDHGHLTDDLTIEDPKAYTKPWTAHLDFVLKPTWTLGEQFCEDEHSFENFDKSGATPPK